MDTDYQFNGHRFQVLRKLFAQTQKELSQQLEIGQSFLSQIERKTRPVPNHLAIRASQVFSLPVTFFSIPSSPLEAGPATFRKTSKARKSEEERIEALYDEASRVFRFVSEESGYRAGELVDPEDYNNDPERMAETMRHLAGLDNISPVPNVTRALERLGFGVVDHLDDTIVDSEHTGISRPSPLVQRPLVAIVGKVPGGVKRLTLLHEAYHHIADRRLAHKITSSRSPEEQQAFRFAGAFLLPADVVYARISESLPLHGYLAIKADYGLSALAIIRRAKDLKVISPARYRSLSIQASSAGWRRNEPVEIADERPILLGQALIRVFGANPTFRASESIGTKPAWIRRWAHMGESPRQASSGQNVVSIDDLRNRM